MTYIPYQPTILEVATWAEFKLIVLTQKDLRLNHLETEFTYDIRGSDTERFRIVLQKGTSDAIDFEMNYKAASNARYDTRTVLVTEAGALAISEIGTPFPVGATAIAGEDTNGDAASLRVTSLGALKVARVAHPVQRVSLSATSPATADTVPHAAVAVPEGMTDIKVEATLATTDGTPTGGKLSVWLQTSVDGSDWTDWLPMMLEVNSNTEAYTVRYADAPPPKAPPTSIEGLIPVGKNLTPSAQLPCGGSPDNYLRVIFVAGAGTVHGVAQTIWLIGSVPT
jgi:hypothetical protein